MADAPDIASALERNRRVFVRKPSVARERTHTCATSTSGFLAVCREGSNEMICDMPPIMGGTGKAPTPGVWGRACLAGCIAMGIRISAESRGVLVAEIAVDLSMDWDNRGMFGMDGVSAGPGNIQLRVTLTSSAPEEELRDVVAAGLRNDAWLIALQEPHAVLTEVQVNRGG